jgi:hypothetical protein
MLLRRPIPVLAAVALTVGLLAAPSAAVAAPDQELPFVCGQEWTGTTRPNHRPSPLAIDFNRPKDMGRLVLASASGVVSRVEDTGPASYGRWIKIDHPEGYSTIYAHLKVQWVVPGQFVDQGTPIGRVGASGGVTGAHLHYEQLLGRSVVAAVFGQLPFVYGSKLASLNCPDVPLAGDWNGNGAHDVAVFRRSKGTGTFEMSSPSGPISRVRFGLPSDLPLVGDWDGDGRTDLGVRRAGGRLFLLRGADGTLTEVRFGVVKDRPVTGDWNGDGRTDLGVWRPAVSRFRLLQPDGTVRVVPLGGRGAQPVTGDWDGDGVTDLGVFDSGVAAFTLRTVSPEGLATLATVPLGLPGDLPVTGDWNADGITDVGTWSPGTATYTLRVTPPPSASRRSPTVAPEIRTLTFGRPRW